MNSNTSIARFARIGAAGLACLAGTLTASAGSNTFTFGEDEDRQTVVVTGQDGQRIRVEIVGDRDPVVELDGKRLGTNRFEFDRDAREITILDGNGNAIRTITMTAPTPPTPPGVRGFAWGATTLGQNQPLRSTRNIWPEAPAASRPPVMIGIYRSDPSPALMAHLGIEGQNAFVIDKVIPGLGADRAGIRQYDVVVEVDGGPASELSKVLSEKEPGSELEVVIIRRGEKKTLHVELDAYDDEKLMVLAEEDAARELRGMISAPAPALPPAAPAAPGAPSSPFIVERFTSDRLGDSAREAIREALANLENQLSGNEMDQVRKSLESAMAQLEERRAMAQDRMLRLEDGKLFVSPGLSQGFDRAGDELEARFNELESRFEELESRWEGLADRLEERFERMIERMERRRGSGDG